MKNQDKRKDRLSYEEYLLSSLSGYKGIVVAMLHLMMRDLTIPDSEIQVSPHDSKDAIKRKKKKKFYKRSAYKFVESEWFEDLCFLLKINPHPIRKQAIERYNESKKR